MKKTFNLLILFAICIMLVGCGENNSKLDSNSNSGKLTCTKTETDENGYKMEDTMIIDYKNNKLTKVQETSIQEMDKDTLDMSLSFGQLFADKLNEIDGFNATYSKESDTKLKTVVIVDYTKFDANKVKEVLGSDIDTDGAFYTNNEVDLDTFKETSLKDYTCN